MFASRYNRKFDHFIESKEPLSARDYPGFKAAYDDDKAEIIAFCHQQLAQYQVRADYQELIQVS